MAYVITEECSKSGYCKLVCPANAIFEQSAKPIIDPELCVYCGICAEVCPGLAIKLPITDLLMNFDGLWEEAKSIRVEE